jgi:hypothetical protein
MAGDADFEASATPTLQQLATFLVDELFSVDRLKRLENLQRNAHAEGATIAAGAQLAATNSVLDVAGETFEFGGRVWQSFAAFIMSVVVQNTFEIEVSQIDLAKLGFSSGRHAVAGTLAKKMVEGLTGGSTSVDASPEPAAKYLSVVLGQAFESWAIGEAIEVMTAIIPGIDKVEKIAELNDKVVNALGIGDSSSRVLRPYIDNLVVEPLRRHIARTYRPNLLNESDALRAFLRGDYTGAELAEELGLLGWSDRRQDILLKSAYKSVSLDDLLVLVRDGQIDRSFVLESLRTQGYDDATAQIALHAAETKRLAAIQDNSLGALQSAYADRRISDAEFSQFLSAIIINEAERGAFEVAARTIRDVNTKRLSPGQAEACVKAGVLPMAAYREALALDGYDPESALALELLLETEIHKDIDVEQLRKQKEAERAAAIAAKAAADAKKQADAEQQRLLARRGPLAELVRAAVRRLIPIARVVEVLAASYDADTVQIYVDDITTQIADADEQQRKADDAKKRAAIRHIDVGSFEQAVLEDVLTLDQFRRQLDTLSFDAADADVLTATLRQRKADLDAARKKRAEADSAAKRQSIDLSRFEQLVRRGVRSLGDYDALLRSLDFDDASRAAMVQLLQLHIDDDVAAAKKRAELAAIDPAKGLALDQYRRAVILGLKTFDDFQAWLLQQKYTTDAQAVLVAELRDDVAQAEAARRKREAPAAGGGAPAIPLSTVARAVRLGIVPPALYQQRLIDAGWSSDDIAIEMALLIQEIADVVAAKTKQAQRDAPAPPPTLTLAELATAARADVLPIAAYQARAHALGYSNDDVDTLVRVLQVSVDAAADARARRAELEAKRTPAGPSLADLRAQVLAGELTLEAYVARLTAAGLDPVDVDMLASLLADELAAG